MQHNNDYGKIGSHSMCFFTAVCWLCIRVVINACVVYCLLYLLSYLIYCETLSFG